MNDHQNLRRASRAWHERKEAGAEANVDQRSGPAIHKSGVPHRTSISIDTGLWESMTDLTFQLGKTTGLRGRLTISRLTAVALEHFYELDEREQVQLIIAGHR